jgi:hypothetical protein
MKYRLIKERFGHPPGTIVYTFEEDVGALASYDTRLTGIKHISVTKRENGRPPGFTVPEADLEKLD